MFGQIGIYLVQTLFGLVVYLALLRFYMQLFRAPFRNPAGQFVMAFTDWAVTPLRKIIPGLRGLDLASFALALVAELAMIAAVFALSGVGLSFGKWIVLAVFGLVRASLYLLILVVIIDFVLSWVNPYTPFGPVLQTITRPFYNFFRKFIPTVGGIDLSPMLVILVVNIILIALEHLEASVRVAAV